MGTESISGSECWATNNRKIVFFSKNLDVKSYYKMAYPNETSCTYPTAINSSNITNNETNPLFFLSNCLNVGERFRCVNIANVALACYFAVLTYPYFFRQFNRGIKITLEVLGFCLIFALWITICTISLDHSGVTCGGKFYKEYSNMTESHPPYSQMQSELILSTKWYWLVALIFIWGALFILMIIVLSINCCMKLSFIR